MEYAIAILFIAAVYVAVPKRTRREDPLDRGPAVAEQPRRGPRINHKVKDAAWAEQYVSKVATSGNEPLRDEDVRKLYTEIVTNDELNGEAKYYMLDGLLQRTANDHLRGMSADVLEEISNESIALTHPEWHGRHGDWHSVKGQ